MANLTQNNLELADFAHSNESSKSHGSLVQEPDIKKQTDTDTSQLCRDSQDQDGGVEHQDGGHVQGGQNQGDYVAGAKLFLLLLGMYLSILCLAMDKTMLSPALGAISTEFGTVKDVGWYSSSYLLTTASVQSLFGIAYKLFDTKWLYIGSISVFEIGSLIAALSPTSSVLILGRAICGVGDAGIACGTYVIITKAVPLHKRPLYLGLMGAFWGVASIIGPLLGGFFAGRATWRWCFYINLPMGAISAITMIFCFPSTPKPIDGTKKPSILSRLLALDLIGASALLPSIVMLLLALQWGGTEFAWKSATIIGLFVGSAALAVIFVLVQLRLQDRGLLPPRFFRTRDVCIAMLFNLFFGAGYYVMLPYISLFYQATQGVSADQVGLRLLPLTLSAVISSIGSGILITRLGSYNVIILVEMALISIGAGLITTWKLNTPMAQWFGFEVIWGLGVGVGFQAGQVVLQNTLKPELIPQASANVQFFGTLGGSISVAIAQAVFQNGLIAAMERDTPTVSPTIAINTGATELKRTLEGLGLSDSVVTSVINSYVTGLRNTYYIGTAAAICAFLAALGFQWRRLPKAPGKQSQATSSNANDEAVPEVEDR